MLVSVYSFDFCLCVCVCFVSLDKCPIVFPPFFVVELVGIEMMDQKKRKKEKEYKEVKFSQHFEQQ